ncbi:hypothetical protein [Nocardiopsis sp. LOL_012]|uniref:hypothetical protein n=1 Tax=Nocardiopsis sp. LOL_012 TaxID=3345409 RepID=UPI003A85964F
MKRFSAVSGLVLATGLALGALSAPASADNNSDVQNITVPICVDAVQAALASIDGCNVVDKKSGFTTFVD